MISKRTKRLEAYISAKDFYDLIGWCNWHEIPLSKVVSDYMKVALNDFKMGNYPR